jgi:hypothetical protein
MKARRTFLSFAEIGPMAAFGVDVPTKHGLAMVELTLFNRIQFR